MKNSLSITRFSLIIAISLAAALIIYNYAGEKLQKAEIICYQKITGKRAQHIMFDSAGVPKVVYEGTLGEKYNPVAVAEYVIRAIKENDTSDCGNINNSINWLISRQVKLNDSAVIYYCYFDWPKYGMKSPWRSAMSQGRSAQAFISVFTRTGDSVYLDYARRAIYALYTPVDQGGVSYFDSSGIWYEEYADDSCPESRVLNGMCVVLISLDDYYKITGDPQVSYLFSEGVRSLKSNISHFEERGNSYYDILRNQASPWYHTFHIQLIGELYKRTGDPVFRVYQEKWTSYDFPSFLDRQITKPTRIGIFTMFLIFICVFALLWGIDLILFRPKAKSRS